MRIEKECVHCGGYGMCDHAVIMGDGEGDLWYECDMCGKGLVGGHAPTCKVCGGKGYHIIDVDRPSDDDDDYDDPYY